MTPIIEGFRLGSLGEGSLTWTSLGYASLVSLALTFVGLVIFNKVDKTFVDTV